MLKRGYDVDDFVGHFSFNLNVFGNIWEQVAKFRAARKLWARNLKEKYGVKKDSNMYLRGLFGGGGYGLTKAQPENNIMRGAYYALSAALAGAQTIALCSYDEAYTIPTPHSAIISLRTLQLLMDEIGLRDTVDPLAGSYFIETITKEMEAKIEEEMAKIEKIGGITQAVSTGYVQRLVSQQAYEYEKGLQSGELKKVGLNIHTEGEPMDVELHEYTGESAEKQIAALKQLRRERSDADVKRTLKELETGTTGGKECHAVSRRMLQGLRDGGRDDEGFQGCVRGVSGTGLF